MKTVLVDANVLLDIITSDPEWFDWSAAALKQLSGAKLAINPIIYAELAAGFLSERDLEEFIAPSGLVRLDLPYACAFRAGKAFLQYRKNGGPRRSPLPDFYIGAHALLEGMTLLTRDEARYRTYFPGIRLKHP